MNRSEQLKQNPTRAARRSAVVGVTSDGVTVLRPVVKPTHFTHAQIKKTIKEVLAGTRIAEPAKP